MLAVMATLAIVVQDHSALRSAPKASGTELTTLWQGDVVEVREERADYLRVYDYPHERGGYVQRDRVRLIGTAAADAPALLAVLRFLKDTRGAEALGISYGAAYLRAAPAPSLNGEPFDAIATMAERLADQASGSAGPNAALAAHLEVVAQLGVQIESFERHGGMQACYDGELYRRVLALPNASAEERARAALGLTRSDCIDPAQGVALRASLDEERAALLDSVSDRDLSVRTRARVRARRAEVWAARAFEEARRGTEATPAAQRAVSELLGVRAADFGEDHQGEYLDALVRVGVIRWAALPAKPQSGALRLSAVPGGAPGQTCVVLQAAAAAPGSEPLHRCTYGIVWMASVKPIAAGHALVLAVQPLESWRELWLFRETAAGWTVDVLSPGSDEPEVGYVEFAGFAPGTRRVLIARELRTAAGFRRRFEEIRLADLALVKQASRPELLVDFGRWQDVDWRRDTLCLH